MNRRPVLRALAAALPAVVGCLGGTPRSSDETTTTRTTTDGGRRLSVERVETFAYAIRLNDLGDAPAGGVRAVEDLSAREREVVEAAIDGGYETTDPASWLVEFAAGTQYVARDGDYYRLRHTLPTYEITAEPVAENEVSGEIATRDAYRDAVTHDGRVTSGLLRLAERHGYTLVYVWPSLRAFLDEYDAARYRGRVLDFAVFVEDPGPPYEVTAEPASLADLADGPVWDASDAPADLRSVVRAAGDADGVYPLADPPEGLLDRLDANEYVHLDGTFYTTYVETRGPLPVSVSASVPDPALDGDGARLRLALRNDADSPVEVMTGAPRPFGVLYFHPVGDPDDRRLLWSDAYEESEYVHTDGREVTAVNDIGLVVDLAPGDEADRTFVVEADIPDGEYVVESDVSVQIGDRDATLPFRVTFKVE